MAENETAATAVPESNASSPDSNAAAGNAKTVKDRQCQFCEQSFTSSSLGRHLDLYIKPKNPKPPDGVHDVEEIRKLRGGITRRQPKSGAKGPFAEQAGRRDSMGGKARRQDENNSPMVMRANMRETAPATTYFNAANWQATGVINNLPPRGRPQAGSTDAHVPPPQLPRLPTTPGAQSQRAYESRSETNGDKVPRNVYDGEGMSKLQEAAELGRAAEMALREVLGSLEAAQKKVKPAAIFDEFEFFSLSFPALCLAILPPPTTLFSPTPFPSADSWTLAPPGRLQFEALNRYLNERTIARKRTEKIADSVLFQHHSHLGAAMEHWQSFSPEEQSRVWNLEILRAFARAQESKVQLRADLEASQQHARHLEAQYDRLSRCQLPREYLMHPPNTLPVQPPVLRQVDPTRFRTGVAEVNYDAEVLIAKWKSQIKATYRPPRPSWAASHQNVPTYKESDSGGIRDDIVMNGSIFGINGPMPRSGNMHTGTASHPTNHLHVSCETPALPGTVMSEEVAGDAPDDAEGEVENAAPTMGENGAAADAGALVRRHDMAGFEIPPILNGEINGNGKRPLGSGSVNGRENKVYRAQLQDDGV